MLDGVMGSPVGKGEGRGREAGTILLPRHLPCFLRLFAKHFWLLASLFNDILEKPIAPPKPFLFAFWSGFQILVKLQVTSPLAGYLVGEGGAGTTSTPPPVLAVLPRHQSVQYRQHRQPVSQGACTASQ